MIEITPLAQEKLASFLAENKLAPQVRIAFPSGCCDGDQLILVPGQPAAGDISIDFGPLTLCLDRDIHEQVGRVQIDFRDLGHDYGFVVECERSPLDAGLCEGCTDCV